MPTRYMAPETLQNLENEENFPEAPLIYGVKSDVWSFGVLLWEMFTKCQQVPYDSWENSTDFRAKLHTGIRLTMPQITPKEMYCVNVVMPKQFIFRIDLATQCWSWEADKRPDFSECLRQTESVFETSARDLVLQCTFLLRVLLQFHAVTCCIKDSDECYTNEIQAELCNTDNRKLKQNCPYTKCEFTQ